MANTTSHTKEKDDTHMRGGTREQHAEAGRQSHKNTDSKESSRSNSSGSAGSQTSSTRR